MELKQKRFFNKTKILFIFLTLLAIVQVVWWSYLLISQQDMIAYLDITQSEKTQQFKRMILFEAAFFVFFWSLSLLYTYKTFKQHEKLNKAHSLFIGAISHELKTPIANIMLSLETLERPQLEDHKRLHYIQKAKKSLQSLLEQVENILNLTSLDGLSHQKTKVLVKPLVENILSTYYEQGTLNSDEIRLKIDNDFYILESPVTLTIILKNLIDNALKYTKKIANRNIQITCSYHNKKPFFEIYDNGIGMTSEELNKCSNAFWRSERVINEAYAGSGLGLTLLHEIAKKSNIDLKMLSEGINKGLSVKLIWR